MTNYTTVCSVDELSPGEREVVSIGDGEAVVFNVEGEYFAVKNECTHHGWSLEEGDIREGVITCPLHRGSFDVETGEVVGPPPDEPVPCYDVIVDGEMIKLATQ